jgi:rare lipoprotein A
MRQYVLVVFAFMFLFSSTGNTAERKNGTTAKVGVERMTTASWYKHGKVTANGEKFYPYGFTVAHKTLPFGTIVRFTNPETNKEVIARVNDRGPFVKGREFDLSIGCAIQLGMKDKGVSKLKVKIIL